MSVLKGEAWSRAKIDEIKAEIKAELDQVASEKDEEQAVRAALHRLSMFADDPDSEAQLRVYIYIVSALVRFHRCDKGLTLSQVQNLVDRAYMSLKIMRVRLENRRIRFLYGDLHEIVSQIQRRHGEHFRAAWEQQLAIRLYRDANERSEDFQAHNAGVRALRLGTVDYAIELFAAAEQNASDDLAALSAAFGWIRANRLAGHLAEAKAKLKEVQGRCEEAEHLKLDWQWESALLELQETGDLTNIARMVGRDRSHFVAKYVTQAMLLGHANLSLKVQETLPSAQTVKRSRVIDASAHGPILQVISLLDQLYDSDYGFDARLQKLGKALTRLHELDNIEQELWAWLAATRWLVRSRLWGLARISLAEYHARSLRLTQGRNDDVLNLGADLRGRQWEDSVPIKSAS